MLFWLDEYEEAAAVATGEAIMGLALAKSPFLAGVRSERMAHVPVSRITDRDGRELELEPVPIRVPVELDLAPVIQGDIGAVLAALDAAGAIQEAGLSKALLSSLSDVTDFTGNTIDAGGQPLSWDLVTDMVEKMEVDFDDNGEMDLVLVMNPRDVERLEKLAPPTPEQEERREAVITKKREAWEARQRERRLV